MILNGPSNSGKSSLGAAMMTLLDHPWFFIPVDAASGIAVHCAVTVLVACSSAWVYLAGFLMDYLVASGIKWLTSDAGLADHFELLGYVIAAVFATS